MKHSASKSNYLKSGTDAHGSAREKVSDRLRLMSLRRACQLLGVLPNCDLRVALKARAVALAASPDEHQDQLIEQAFGLLTGCWLGEKEEPR